MIGELKPPSICAISISFEGIFDKLSAPAASYTLPSAHAALNFNASTSLAFWAIILAGAVQSSWLIAIAVGPSKCSANPSYSVPFIASLIKVFLATL